MVWCAPFIFSESNPPLAPGPDPGPKKHRKRPVSPPLQISRNSTPNNESTLRDDPDFIDEKEITDYKIDM